MSAERDTRAAGLADVRVRKPSALEAYSWGWGDGYDAAKAELDRAEATIRDYEGMFQHWAQRVDPYHPPSSSRLGPGPALDHLIEKAEQLDRAVAEREKLKAAIMKAHEYIAVKTPLDDPHAERMLSLIEAALDEGDDG